MCLLQCRICRANGFVDYCPKCEHLAYIWEKKEAELHKTKNELDDLRSNVCGLIEKYADQILYSSTGTVEVSSKDIEKMWEQIGVRYTGKVITEIREFCRHSLLEAAIMCDAAMLFRAEEYYGKTDFLSKLEILYGHIEDYHRFMEWNDDAPDYTPEYIINELIEPKGKERFKVFWERLKRIGIAK